MVAGVHRALEAEAPGLLTLLVPRHPTRGAAIARELMAAGFRVARRGAGEAIEPDTQIYLADTLGELGLFFRLAHIVFMGKSLVPLGGQNPLEALILECAVLHGPHMANFQLICEQMAGAGCARQVADGMALASTVGELLADPPTCAAMAAKGLAFARAEAQVVDRVLAAITGIMDEGHADT
jgi:3-deoxy-D-manno-octulosonic-acid transferase